jgi:tetratricopeptide (TPR) repeat protein
MTGSMTAADEVAALVSEGNAALLAGDAYNARQRFRRALELDPERIEAWIGLAGSVRPYREKREHLQRALAISPDHPEAGAVLAYVESRIAAGEVLAPGGVQVREPLPPSIAPPAPEEPAEPVATTDLLACYIHPDRDTGLRCTSCERPICGECATRAAVGQLCPECTKARRPVNYQVGSNEIIIASVIAVFYGLIVSFLALQILGTVGFFGFIIAFLLGPMAGDFLVRLADRATKNKRGRPIQLALGIGYALGALPWISLIILFGRSGSVFIILLIFSILAVSTAITRVR